jgi:hypothetical protein
MMRGMTAASPGEAPAHGSIAVEGRGADPAALLRRVGLATGTSRPVILVCGGADDMNDAELAAARAVLGPAVRDAVSRTGAVVVDGGTDAGVMQLVGAERARDPLSMPVVLGVAPAGKVEHGGATGGDRIRLARDHTQFVLADSADWGGETALMMALAEELSAGAPVVMVLAGGGDGASAEVREAVARGWPVFAIAGTGGVADALGPKPPPRDGARRMLTALADRAGKPSPPSELTGADIRRAAAGDVAGLARSLAWELQAEPILKRAWRSFATYDALAVRSRGFFERLQRWTLGLGVAGTVVALAHAEVANGDLKDVLHWTAVVTPIVVATLIALANKSAAGKRWILLRAAAEAVKSEIYRCRTQTGPYAADKLSGGKHPVTRDARLAAQIKDIQQGLILTDASGGALTPYSGPLPPAMYGAEAADDGLSRLDAKGYVAIRTGDQLAYYHGRVARLARKRAWMQIVTIAAGGLGAVLAAAGAEIWVGATTALAGAFLAHLGYLQVDNTIVNYNRAAAALDALQCDLEAHSTDAADLETIVERGETVLTTELGGWVQQMQEALAELQARQAEAKDPDER